MLIDSCASGGRRNDLETMRRSIPLWLTKDSSTKFLIQNGVDTKRFCPTDAKKDLDIVYAGMLRPEKGLDVLLEPVHGRLVVPEKGGAHFGLDDEPVERALQELSTKSIIELDDERKAAMVSNLLVVLCGDKAVHPVVNTGTLYT